MGATTVDVATVARRLNLKVSTIRNACARFHREGWSCRVAYVARRSTGGILVQRGHRAGRAAYHPDYRAEARRLVQCRLHRARWERLPTSVRDALLQRAHDDTVTRQAETAPAAVRAGRRWSPDEDAYLARHWQAPAYEVARTLGRSLYAVRWRKTCLRRRRSCREW